MMALLGMLGSRMGLVGLVLAVIVGLVQQARVTGVRAELAHVTAQAEAARQARDQAMATRATALAGNRALQAQIATQNAAILSLSVQRDAAIARAKAALGQVEQRTTTRRQSRPPGTGPAWLNARLAELVQEAAR